MRLTIAIIDNSSKTIDGELSKFTVVFTSAY